MKLHAYLFLALALVAVQVSALDHSKKCIITDIKEPESACHYFCQKKHGWGAVGVCKGPFCACLYNYVAPPRERPSTERAPSRNAIMGGATRGPRLPIGPSRAIMPREERGRSDNRFRPYRIPVPDWRNNNQV